MKKKHVYAEKMFRLGKNETRILHLIEKTPLGINTMTVQSGIPRTTINGLITSLLHRGFIEIVPFGKRKKYILKPQDVVQKKSEELQKILYPKSALLNTLGIQVSDNTEVKIHRGTAAMLQIFERLGAENKNQRIFGIQPNASIYQVMQKVSVADLIRINDRIRKNNLIVEAVLEENSTAALGALLNKKDTKRLIESFTGRKIDHVSVPSEFLQFESELYITPNTAFIMEWDAEVGIEIRNPHILKLLTAMFYATKALGKRFNQGEDMTNYLKKLEQKTETIKIEK